METKNEERPFKVTMPMRKQRTEGFGVKLATLLLAWWEISLGVLIVIAFLIAGMAWAVLAFFIGSVLTFLALAKYGSYDRN